MICSRHSMGLAAWNVNSVPREAVMPIRFACPNCGQWFERPDADAGKSGKCPCGASVRVEPPPPIAFPAVSVAASQAAVQSAALAAEQRGSNRVLLVAASIIAVGFAAVAFAALRSQPLGATAAVETPAPASAPEPTDKLVAEPTEPQPVAIAHAPPETTDAESLHRVGPDQTERDVAATDASAETPELGLGYSLDQYLAVLKRDGWEIGEERVDPKSGEVSLSATLTGDIGIVSEVTGPRHNLRERTWVFAVDIRTPNDVSKLLIPLGGVIVIAAGWPENDALAWMKSRLAASIDGPQLAWQDNRTAELKTMVAKGGVLSVLRIRAEPRPPEVPLLSDALQAPPPKQFPPRVLSGRRPFDVRPRGVTVRDAKARMVEADEDSQTWSVAIELQNAGGGEHFGGVYVVWYDPDGFEIQRRVAGVLNPLRPGELRTLTVTDRLSHEAAGQMVDFGVTVE